MDEITIKERQLTGLWDHCIEQNYSLEELEDMYGFTIPLYYESNRVEGTVYLDEKSVYETFLLGYLAGRLDADD